MKNTAIKLFALSLLAPMMITGCTKGKKGPIWSEEIDAEMEKYIGEVLPFVELDKETLQYGYDESYSMFYLYDDNEANLVEDYGTKLEAAGFEYTEEDFYGVTYTSYDKDNDVGHISVTFGWAEATESEPAGNYINVSIPEFIDEEVLLANGYEKQQGWPAQLVADTLDGSGITMSPVNEDGEWYVASQLYVDEDDGSSYYCAYLASAGDYTAPISDCLTQQGLTWDADYGCFYDATSTTNAEIYPSLIRGYTILNIYGQTIEPETPDVNSETVNDDGSIDVTFTFGGSFTDGQTFESHTFESTSANLVVSKGTANNAPAYYDNGSTLRFYAGSTLAVSAATGYTISSVELTVGPSNSKKWTNAADLYGLTSGTAAATDTTTTITSVNASSLTITLGVGKTSGNIAFSSVVVKVIAAE